MHKIEGKNKKIMKKIITERELKVKKIQVERVVFSNFEYYSRITTRRICCQFNNDLLLAEYDIFFRLLFFLLSCKLEPFTATTKSDRDSVFELFSTMIPRHLHQIEAIEKRKKNIFQWPRIFDYRNLPFLKTH